MTTVESLVTVDRRGCGDWVV